MSEIKFNLVPGMTEPVEQKLLFELSKKVDLRDDEVIYEFGPFFGRSTYYLALGLKENKTNKKHQIHTYDIFQCQADSFFASHVYKHAKAASVSHLLEVEDGVLDFSQIFENYLSEHIKDETVKTHKTTLVDSYPVPDKKIALMHIDSPKKYRDFRDILFRFFPLLRKESLIVFQDFFYHWSGTLIAVIQILVEMGLIRMLFTSASSLVVIVLDSPDESAISEIDKRMSEEYLPGLVDGAIQNTERINNVDRREHFEPRLHLAKIQLLMENGEFEKASEVFNHMLANKKVTLASLYNFSEMLGKNFTIKSGLD